MWIIVSFDIPATNASEYRKMRKSLLQNGFLPLQKSLYFRWSETVAREKSIRHRLCAVAASGSFLLLTVPENCMSAAAFLHDGKPERAPDPPLPWCVF